MVYSYQLYFNDVENGYKISELAQYREKSTNFTKFHEFGIV